MSNAVDIVMVGGARAGRMVCMDRARMSTGVSFLGDNAVEFQYLYTVAEREIDGVWYRFGYPTGEAEPSDAEVIAAGAIAQWDLNRVQRTPSGVVA